MNDEMIIHGPLLKMAFVSLKPNSDKPRLQSTGVCHARESLTNHYSMNNICA